MTRAATYTRAQPKSEQVVYLVGWKKSPLAMGPNAMPLWSAEKSHEDGYGGFIPEVKMILPMDETKAKQQRDCVRQFNKLELAVTITGRLLETYSSLRVSEEYVRRPQADPIAWRLCNRRGSSSTCSRWEWADSESEEDLLIQCE